MGFVSIGQCCTAMSEGQLHAVIEHRVMPVVIDVLHRSVLSVVIITCALMLIEGLADIV